MLVKLVLLALALPLLLADEDFYRVLGVSRDATPAQIKAKYRQLARKFHPDKVRGEKKKERAQHKFMKINEAYETLSDDEKRKQYDMFGKDGEGAANPFAGSRGGPGGFSFSTFDQTGSRAQRGSQQGMDINIEEILASMGRAGGGQGGHRRGGGTMGGLGDMFGAMFGQGGGGGGAGGSFRSTGHSAPRASRTGGGGGGARQGAGGGGAKRAQGARQGAKQQQPQGKARATDTGCLKVLKCKGNKCSRVCA